MHVPLFLALLAGCGQTAPTAPSAPPATAAVAPAPVPEAAPAAAAAAPSIALNDGARWKTDAHTAAVMAETRAALAAPGPATLDAALALGASLQDQLDRLIQGCTMTGPDHDALHVFIGLWFQPLQDLRAAEDLATAQARADELREILVAYDRAFE